MAMSFADTVRAEQAALLEAMIRLEDAALIQDGRRPITAARPFVPCPPNIGNDPCDDWSEPDWDEDY